MKELAPASSQLRGRAHLFGVDGRQRLLRHHGVEALGADALVHVVPGDAGVVPGSVDTRHVPRAEHVLRADDFTLDAQSLHDERKGRQVARADRLAVGQGSWRRAGDGVGHGRYIGALLMRPYAKCLPSRVSLPWSETGSPAPVAFFLRLACQPLMTPMAAGMAEMAMMSTSTSSKCSCTKGTPPKK